MLADVVGEVEDGRSHGERGRRFIVEKMKSVSGVRSYDSHLSLQGVLPAFWDCSGLDML